MSNLHSDFLNVVTEIFWRVGELGKKKIPVLFTNLESKQACPDWHFRRCCFYNITDETNGAHKSKFMSADKGKTNGVLVLGLPQSVEWE